MRTELEECILTVPFGIQDLLGALFLPLQGTGTTVKECMIQRAWCGKVEGTY